eukprot:Colp12_sorted_trinity150504_noHs@19105
MPILASYSEGPVSVDTELNDIVREYLEYGDYSRTLEAFDEDCENKGRPVRPNTARRNKDAVRRIQIQNEFLGAFDDGDVVSFFTLWDQYIPPHIRHDANTQKLEFNLNIYFAIYPLHHAQAKNPMKTKLEDSMKGFKTFLETRGAELSKTTEFLSFYALPFIPDPTTHPSFTHLFENGWQPELKQKLEQFLGQTLKSMSKPQLVEIFLDHVSPIFNSTNNNSCLRASIHCILIDILFPSPAHRNKTRDNVWICPLSRHRKRKSNSFVQKSCRWKSVINGTVKSSCVYRQVPSCLRYHFISNYTTSVTR